jgi:hypothetical protein
VIQAGEIARIMVEMLPKLGAEDTAVIGVNLPGING